MLSSSWLTPPLLCIVLVFVQCGGGGGVTAASSKWSVSDRACVEATAGLHLRAAPCTNASVVTTAPYSEAYSVAAAPTTACGFTWLPLVAASGTTVYADAAYLYKCGGVSSSWNRFGIGLVSPGNTEQWDFAANLGGHGGFVLLTFPGVDATTTAPDPSWVQAVQAVTAAGLTPVVRLSPPWGQSHYRSESDDAAHMNYTTLAAAFRAVVAGLPLTGRTYFQIDNEPNLCPEWFCATAASAPLSYKTMAAEYASFFTYVADALHGLGDTRVKVAPAALAPGGNIQCGCCGSQNCAGDKGGVTGLDFMDAMVAAVPDVFARADWLATHSYPASGVGYGFNVPMPSAVTGLNYWQLELAHVKRSLAVGVTETGWATAPPGGNPPCTEADKATWTVQAYNEVWNATQLMGIMPFMLQDATWGGKYGYEYVDGNNHAVAVYAAVQKLRCATGFNTPPC